MAVFNRKENVDDFFELDPFDPFSTEMRPPHGNQSGRKSPAGIWANILVGAVLALFMAGGAFYALNVRQDLWTRGDQHVYVELKVIDASGRPAVGATVKDRKKILGVTDSFGEWRRFVRVPLGSSFLVEVTKQTASGTLNGSKNLAIPPSAPRSGDLEVRGTVQLTGRTGGLVALRSLSPDSGDGSGPAPGALSGPGPGEGRLPQEPTQAPTPGGEYGTVWFTAREPQTESTVELLRALGQRARDLGLEVNPASPWQLQISDLGGGNQDLIQIHAVDLSGGAARPLFSYLKVRQASPLLTARDILWAATLHAAKSYQVIRSAQGWRLTLPREELWKPALGKALVDARGGVHWVAPGLEPGSLQLRTSGGDPCDGAHSCTLTASGMEHSPPVAGWQRLSMRVLGASGGRPVEIYVSGYQAWRIDAETFGFWGQPQAAANVTVVRDGRIVFRQRMISDGQAVPRIHIPSPPLSSL